MLSSIRFVGVFVLVGISLLSRSANAEQQIFTIDSSQSSLSVGGTLGGTSNFASPQAPGSTTTSYQGTITVDRTANTIDFINGSVIDAIIKGNYQPEPDGTEGTFDPADYGRQAPGPFFTTLYEAIRGLQLDLDSDDPITITGGGTFDSGQFAVIVDAGDSDWSYGNAFGQTSLAGKGTANGSGTPSTLTTAGATETLTLFISTGPILYSVAQSNDSTLTFGGQIVATRVVPEPVTGALAFAILGGALGIRRRR